MNLLRASAEQSGLLNRLSFLIGASFIYLSLIITPAHANEPAPTASPAPTPSEASPSPTQSPEPIPTPTPTQTTEPAPSPTPSTSTLIEPAPNPTPTPESSPVSTSTETPVPSESPSPYSTVLPTLEFETSSQPNLATEPTLVFEPVSSTEPQTTSTPEESQSTSPTELSLQSTPFAITSQNTDPTPVVEETITGGGDDISYRIPLTTSVIYDGVVFNDIYATTNSVITFGNPDNTYWAYPSTPSISINSIDWWVRPSLGDEWLILRTSDGGFQVDLAARPYGNNSNEITNIVITAQITTSGTVSYSYSVTGPTYEDTQRTGARLTDGSIVTLEEAGIIQVDEPVELASTPVDPGLQPPQEPETDSELQPQPEPIPLSPELSQFLVSIDVNPFSTAQEPQPETPTEPESSDSDTETLPQDSDEESSEEETQNQEEESSDVPEDNTPSDIPGGPESPEDTPESSDNQPTDSSTDSNTEDQVLPSEEESIPTLPEETDGILEFGDEQISEESQEPNTDSQEQENQLEESYEDTTALQQAVSAVLKKFINAMAVPLSALVEAGIDVKDLPPETPIEVRTDADGSPVIITAEIATALQTLESPAALLTAAFDNPELVLAALANVGADMSEQEREEAQRTVVAAIIAAGAAISGAATRISKK